MRPAATALTARVTRMTPSSSSTLTSAKVAAWVLLRVLLILARGVGLLLLDAVDLP